ncbi:ABC transporter permease [Actinoalloteichus sp. AHMU CJ021]|uniref:ABC-2 type transport system permease protein n=1 Tax=Actinoalloteichus caeruleus DSM 43889 TaxID=1120930 RepID=A0ABT1JJ28_ACTCY|nr:ABC transporter permease [Actinoalloteichus caeruleus]AUS78428.1 ABC transporter permease [Actinoalloteichus sp. AHMU CJ021]MCP2332513.1 ABC-2 type transport system permease protein [Actinoalloteichus caeruleus DSM 43889]
MSAPTQQRQVGAAQGTWLVARREITTRVRSKAFIFGTLAIILAIGGYIALISFLGNGESTSRVGVTSDTAVIGEQLTVAGDALGQTIEVEDVTDAAAAEQRVRDGDLDVLLTGSPSEPVAVVDEELDTQLNGVLTAVVQQQALNERISEAGLDPVAVQQEVAGTTVEVRALGQVDEDLGQRLMLAVASAFLLYMAVILYGSMVTMGVIEEKASRVVELLLSTLRPWQLMLGKVLGIGTVGLIQVAAIGIVGVVAGVALDAFTLPGAAALTILSTVMWYLLGFLSFAALFATAGSLVSRQEDASSVTTPITLLAVLPFVIGFPRLMNDANDTVSAVLSYVPLFSPTLMSTRTALGVAEPWEIALAVALSIAATGVFVWVGGRLYSNAVLRTGSRVKLRDALRG